MSYASDLGLPVNKIIEHFTNATSFLFIPSETSFLKKQFDADMKPRDSWKKALDYLFGFIEKNKPSVIGLQELNRWYDYGDDPRKTGYDFTQSEISGYEFGKKGTLYTEKNRLPKKNDTPRTFVEMNLNNRNAMSLGYEKTDTDSEWKDVNSEEWGVPKGVEAIVEKLKKLEKYDYFHDEVYGTGNGKSIAGRFAAMIIWDTTVLGNFYAGQVFSFAFDTARPLLFVITKKDNKYTLLINAHAPNKPNPIFGIYDANYDAIKADIILKYNIFIAEIMQTTKQNITFTNIYITGDFNDRYGNFLNEESRTLFRTRNANNLSVPTGKYNGEFNIGGKVLTFTSDTAPTSCCYNWDSTKSEISKNPLDGDIPSANDIISRAIVKNALPPKRGEPSNYYYVGDYCFSSNGGTLMVDTPSQDSDHQLVYLTEPTSGGRRRRRNSSRKSRRQNKRRASRRRRH